MITLCASTRVMRGRPPACPHRPCLRGTDARVQHAQALVSVLDFPDRVPTVRGDEVVYFLGVAAPGDRFDDLAKEAHVGGHVDRRQRAERLAPTALYGFVTRSGGAFPDGVSRG